MKTLMPVLAVALGALLAIVIGPHITTEAAAVLVGVCIGAGASIPVAILLIALLRRESRAGTVRTARTEDTD